MVASVRRRPTWEPKPGYSEILPRLTSRSKEGAPGTVALSEGFVR
jgi:hypothetical protein